MRQEQGLLFKFLTYYICLSSYIANVAPSVDYNVNKLLSFTPFLFFFSFPLDNINITSNIYYVYIFI